ncbi:MULTISPECIES: barstar family protein [unclassified Streptomyces]|uniref:barstar family protein n=1 Tax=unclassified Streptomyces TaxID=2593676 RepID=UPI00202FD7D8|nr:MULTISPECIES: barstar family protein [unclassified Streptomyces]MCM1967698.1 barstar family protein [Streptomyces sp. G1]MCX5129066.1 barstar family protein [Streptomyces sp. NBC_00347]
MTLDPRPLAPALEAAEAAGWATVRLDLDGVRSKAELMRRCGAALEVPEYFGGNWDALADALRDLSWLPAAPGRLLVVSSWRGYAEVRPADWETLREVLEEAVDFWQAESEGEGAGPGLTVLLAESGPGPAAGAPPRTPRLKRRRG